MSVQTKDKIHHAMQECIRVIAKLLVETCHTCSSNCPLWGYKGQQWRECYVFYKFHTIRDWCYFIPLPTKNDLYLVTE
jgi:hypothetical protein